MLLLLVNIICSNAAVPLDFLPYRVLLLDEPPLVLLLLLDPLHLLPGAVQAGAPNLLHLALQVLTVLGGVRALAGQLRSNNGGSVRLARAKTAFSVL